MAAQLSAAEHVAGDGPRAEPGSGHTAATAAATATAATATAAAAAATAAAAAAAATAAAATAAGSLGDAVERDGFTDVDHSGER